MEDLQLSVEELLDRKVYSGKTLYLTKWRAFPEEEATWESIKILSKGYKHLINRFHEKDKVEDDGNMGVDQEEDEDEPPRPRRRKFHEQLRRICAHERTSEGAMAYTIETYSGETQKVPARFLHDNHPLELAKYLEKSLLESFSQ